MAVTRHIRMPSDPLSPGIITTGRYPFSSPGQQHRRAEVARKLTIMGLRKGIYIWSEQAHQRPLGLWPDQYAAYATMLARPCSYELLQPDGVVIGFDTSQQLAQHMVDLYDAPQ